MSTISSLHGVDSIYLPEGSSEVALHDRPADFERKQLYLGQCLVASGNAAHRKLLAQVADQFGWDAIICDNALDSQRALLCSRPELAFVDVQGIEGEDFRGLVEDIAGDSQTLQVVCGNVDDLGEEIWARQLGVWFYLPGLRESGSIGLLFRDARTILEARAAKAMTQSAAPEQGPYQVRRRGMTALGRSRAPGRNR